MGIDLNVTVENKVVLIKCVEALISLPYKAKLSESYP